MRTTVGRSVQTKRVAIVLSVASLVVLINEKLELLRGQRPNERDAQPAWDAAVAHYESLKQNLEALCTGSLKLESGEIKEKAVEKSSNAFVRCIRNWWEKKHEQICDKTLDAAIFVSCVTICSLVGAGGQSR